jgi:hypothetical protein
MGAILGLCRLPYPEPSRNSGRHVGEIIAVVMALSKGKPKSLVGLAGNTTFPPHPTKKKGLRNILFFRFIIIAFFRVAEAISQMASIIKVWENVLAPMNTIAQRLIFIAVF